jgi:hypothetical protein
MIKIKILKLKWYEWVGWLVNVLMVTIVTTFIWYSVQGQEYRAVFIMLGLSLIVIGVWTWVLLFYDHPRGMRD